MLSKLFLTYFLLFSHSLIASQLSHINIVVSDVHLAAKTFQKKGFVLKVPHTYKSGVQKGLISQAIHFKSGHYIQLMSIDPSQKSNLGSLALWYQKFLKQSSSAQGLGIVIESTNLKELSKNLLKKSIPNRFKEFTDYQWLSFKTGSPFQHVSFIKTKKHINRNISLFNHRSKALEIHKISVNLQGDPATWSSILQLSGSSSLGLDFSTLTYLSKGVIQRITLKSSLTQCPIPFTLGSIEFTYYCDSSDDKLI